MSSVSPICALTTATDEAQAEAVVSEHVEVGRTCVVVGTTQSSGPCAGQEFDVNASVVLVESRRSRRRYQTQL